MKVHYAFGLLEEDALEFMRPWMQANRDRTAFTVVNFLKHLQDGYRDLSDNMNNNYWMKEREIKMWYIVCQKDRILYYNDNRYFPISWKFPRKKKKKKKKAKFGVNLGRN